MDCIINDITKKMLVADSDTKWFPSFLDGHHFGRGLFSYQKDSAYIIASHQVLVWRVIDDKLQKKDNEKVLFDGENYVIEWHFDYVLNIGGDIKTEVFFFHWKGMNAPKEFSPLPSDWNINNNIVERIYHWGEPPVFVHLFPSKLIVLNGKEEDFNPDTPHLLILKGEIINELHLFEVPCCWASFRSRAIFYLIVPSKKTVYIWFGLGIKPSFIASIRNCKSLYSNIKNVHQLWADFQFIDVFEGKDDILKDVSGNTQDYMSINKNVTHTPRLFDLVFIKNGINSIEIKSSLKAPNVIAAFPFLQTHLYTEAQPAIFLLDNHDEIWLWKSSIKPENDIENFKKHLNKAEELLDKYVEQKKKLQGIDVIVLHTTEGQEPIEFMNLFPFWKS